MNSIPDHPDEGTAVPKFRVASSDHRLIHLIVDSVLSYALVLVLSFCAGFVLAVWGYANSPLLEKDSLLWLFITYGGFIGYFIFFESIWQRTPAKFMTRMKVVKPDGTKPGFFTIVWRTICRFIPFEALSFLAKTFPVGWHDRFSKTLVVPSSYTPREVQKIDLLQLKKYGSNRFVTFFVILFAAIAGVIILGSIIMASHKSVQKEVEEKAAGPAFGEVLNGIK